MVNNNETKEAIESFRMWQTNQGKKPPEGWRFEYETKIVSKITKALKLETNTQNINELKARLSEMTKIPVTEMGNW